MSMFVKGKNVYIGPCSLRLSGIATSGGFMVIGYVIGFSILLTLLIHTSISLFIHITEDSRMDMIAFDRIDRLHQCAYAFARYIIFSEFDGVPPAVVGPKSIHLDINAHNSRLDGGSGIEYISCSGVYTIDLEGSMHADERIVSIKVMDSTTETDRYDFPPAMLYRLFIGIDSGTYFMNISPASV